jgi:hypothetical protein
MIEKYVGHDRGYMKGNDEVAGRSNTGILSLS